MAKFSEIRGAQTPMRRARIETIKAAMAEAERLAELRLGRGMTQAQLAEELGRSQGQVSALERREDLYLSTLRTYVEALGGTLDLAAVFGDERHPIAIGGGRRSDPKAEPARRRTAAVG